eukprot:254943-Chlamydomonas_euryale.AAC.3
MPDTVATVQELASRGETTAQTTLKAPGLDRNTRMPASPPKDLTPPFPKNRPSPAYYLFAGSLRLRPSPAPASQSCPCACIPALRLYLSPASEPEHQSCAGTHNLRDLLSRPHPMWVQQPAKYAPTHPSHLQTYTAGCMGLPRSQEGPIAGHLPKFLRDGIGGWPVVRPIPSPEGSAQLCSAAAGPSCLTATLPQQTNPCQAPYPSTLPQYVAGGRQAQAQAVRPVMRMAAGGRTLGSSCCPCRRAPLGSWYQSTGSRPHGTAGAAAGKSATGSRQAAAG